MNALANNQHTELKQSALSLRAKLILSYLLVILGTIIVLSFVISATVQNYFTQLQIAGQRDTAQSMVASISLRYAAARGWTPDVLSPLLQIPFYNPSLIVVENTQGTQLACGPTSYHNQDTTSDTNSNCQNQVVKDTLSQVLSKNAIQSGTISTSEHDKTFTSTYVCVPITANGQVVGAMFYAQFQSNITGLTAQINWAIILTGLIVACVAALCSFLLVRRFIKPLEALRRAAEQMKEGKYAQRVEQPKAIDELGELALTFNEMADTIESDVNELRRQDQVRRDLIANIAHDLATPLTAIQGLSEALADDVISDPSQRQETAQRIGREIQRLRRLVADVRQMSSLEAGHAQLDLAPLDMQALTEETVTVIEPECEQMGITIHNEIAPHTPLVLADSDRITQVLLNLLDNARRHTPKGGQIRVGARPEGKNLSIWVSDTGVGIDAADLPHIFERFYRADRSRATATGGTGLGLSIVKAILSAHGGTIWAESQPGQGSRFTFTLPIVQTPVPTRPINTKSTKVPALSITKLRSY